MVLFLWSWWLRVEEYFHHRFLIKVLAQKLSGMWRHISITNPYLQVQPKNDHLLFAPSSPEDSFLCFFDNGILIPLTNLFLCLALLGRTKPKMSFSRRLAPVAMETDYKGAKSCTKHFRCWQNLAIGNSWHSLTYWISSRKYATSSWH
jgi:hypothetical protein